MGGPLRAFLPAVRTQAACPVYQSVGCLPVSGGMGGGIPQFRTPHIHAEHMLAKSALLTRELPMDLTAVRGSMGGRFPSARRAHNPHRRQVVELTGCHTTAESRRVGASHGVHGGMLRESCKHPPACGWHRVQRNPDDQGLEGLVVEPERHQTTGQASKLMDKARGLFDRRIADDFTAVTMPWYGCPAPTDHHRGVLDGLLNTDWEIVPQPAARRLDRSRDSLLKTPAGCRETALA